MAWYCNNNTTAPFFLIIIIIENYTILVITRVAHLPHHSQNRNDHYISGALAVHGEKGARTVRCILRGEGHHLRAWSMSRAQTWYAPNIVKFPLHFGNPPDNTTLVVSTMLPHHWSLAYSWSCSKFHPHHMGLLFTLTTGTPYTLETKYFIYIFRTELRMQEANSAPSYKLFIRIMRLWEGRKLHVKQVAEISCQHNLCSWLHAYY